MKLVPLVSLFLALTLAASAAEVTPKAATASSWEQKAHGGWRDFPPALAIDGDLTPNSSWRAEGQGEWIELDLGEEMVVYGIKIPFVGGDSRSYTFEVKVSPSEGGDDWATVVGKTESMGKTADFETTQFNKAPARRVRIIGYGNTKEEFKDWINIVEVRLLAESQAD